MTEVVRPEPMDPHALRWAYVTELIAYKPLIAHLDVDGLLVVRDRLGDVDFVAVCADGNPAELRAATLDAVCRHLVAHGYAPELYFVDSGEILPGADDMPADARELDP